jgi:hypothetical protein
MLLKAQQDHLRIIRHSENHFQDQDHHKEELINMQMLINILNDDQWHILKNNQLEEVIKSMEQLKKKILH